MRWGYLASQVRVRIGWLALWLATVWAADASAQARLSAQTLPNIVLIYADDIGFGDLSCYGNQSVATPNADRLAREGVRHRLAHSTSATCTPSRYSLMTGEYAWRRTGTGILPGDAPALLRAGRQTLPALLKAAGYQTGIVGKWHLGLGGPEGPQWNSELTGTPNDVGFDESFVMAATGDRVPTVYVQNRRVVNLDPADPITVNYKQKIGTEPTGAENPQLLKMKPAHGHDNTIINGVSRIGLMTGGKAARWVDEDMAETFTRQAVRFIQKSNASGGGAEVVLPVFCDAQHPRTPAAPPALCGQKQHWAARRCTPRI
jgi:hypothetical protein